MKYILERKIRLAAGPHKIFLGLPEDNYALESNIIFKEGFPYVLEFKPVYRTKRMPHSIPTFLHGIDKYEIFLDGELPR